MIMKEVTVKQSSAVKDNKSPNKEQKPKCRPLTKVVIRRLPPTIREDAFIEQISPIPDHDYFHFVEADPTLGASYAFCRAYINFKNTDDIFVFKEKFDNYIFVDTKGNEYNAVVEYAPYQGVPKKKSRKCDPKCATIETDHHYLDFLEKLKAQETDTKTEPKTEYSYQIKDEKKITSTPLLEYIAARKIEREKQKAERKEERRKKDLERKRLRDEERRKKKVEIKPRIVATSATSATTATTTATTTTSASTDTATTAASPTATTATTTEEKAEDNALKSSPTTTVPLQTSPVKPITRPKLQVKINKDFACIKNYDPDSDTETSVKMIDFHKSIYPIKKPCGQNPPCLTKFDRWYNERYIYKNYNRRRFFQQNNFQAKANDTNNAVAGANNYSYDRGCYTAWSNPTTNVSSFPAYSGAYPDLSFKNEYGNAQSIYDNNPATQQAQNDAGATSTIVQNFDNQFNTDNYDYGVPSNEKHDWNYLWNLIHGEDEEPEQNKAKTVKTPDTSGVRLVTLKEREKEKEKEREEAAKYTASKSSKEPVKQKGKGFKERRDDSFKKTYEDKRPDSRYKNRDDKRHYENDKFNRKTDYRSNFSRERKRDDDRKFGGSRTDLRDSSRRYESREFHNEAVVKPPVKEVKKYSEARKEREARRNELKRLAAIRAEKEAAAAAEKNQSENPGETTSKDLTSPLEANTESKSDDIENLAEALKEKANIAQETKSKRWEDLDNSIIKVAVREDFSHINKEKDDSKLKESFQNSDNKADILSQEPDVKSETENKKSNSTKKNYDRKDPRTERRIRNKDRPSMAIYQPGKARMSLKEKSSSVDEPVPEQKSTTVN